MKNGFIGPHVRVSSGVSGLDEMLAGGLLPGRPYIVVGPPGSGKTTMALQFLLAGAKRGENVLYVTLDEPPNELRENFKGLPSVLNRIFVFDAIPDVMRYEKAPFKDIAAVREARRLGEVPFGIRRTDEFKSVEISFSALMQALKMETTKRLYSRIVVDSLTALKYFGMKGFDENTGAQVFLRFMSEMRTTALLMLETPVEDPQLPERMLARGEIHLYNWESDRRLVRAIGIEKFRGSPHDNFLHPYRIASHGIIVDTTVSISRETREMLPTVPLGETLLTSKPSESELVLEAEWALMTLLEDVRELLEQGIDAEPVRELVQKAHDRISDMQIQDAFQYLLQARETVNHLILVNQTSEEYKDQAMGAKAGQTSLDDLSGGATPGEPLPTGEAALSPLISRLQNMLGTPKGKSMSENLPASLLERARLKVLAGSSALPPPAPSVSPSVPRAVLSPRAEKPEKPTPAPEPSPTPVAVEAPSPRTVTPTPIGPSSTSVPVPVKFPSTTLPSRPPAPHPEPASAAPVSEPRPVERPAPISSSATSAPVSPPALPLNPPVAKTAPGPSPAPKPPAVAPAPSVPPKSPAPMPAHVVRIPAPSPPSTSTMAPTIAKPQPPPPSSAPVAKPPPPMPKVPGITPVGPLIGPPPPRPLTGAPPSQPTGVVKIPPPAPRPPSSAESRIPPTPPSPVPKSIVESRPPSTHAVASPSKPAPTPAPSPEVTRPLAEVSPPPAQAVPMKVEPIPEPKIAQEAPPPPLARPTPMPVATEPPAVKAGAQALPPEPAPAPPSAPPPPTPAEPKPDTPSLLVAPEAASETSGSAEAIPTAPAAKKHTRAPTARKPRAKPSEAGSLGPLAEAAPPAEGTPPVAGTGLTIEGPAKPHRTRRTAKPKEEGAPHKPSKRTSSKTKAAETAEAPPAQAPPVTNNPAGGQPHEAG